MKNCSVFFIMLSLPVITMAQGYGIPDPILNNGKSIQVNGTEMVYYPTLTLEPADSGNEASTTDDKILNPQIKLNSPAGNNLTGSRKIYGEFNGYLVTEKSSEITGSAVKKMSAGDAKSTSTAPWNQLNRFVLYNKILEKFEVTEGYIQVEIKPNYEYVNLSQRYDVNVISKYLNYVTVIPRDPVRFIEIHDQLLKDSRIEQALLRLVPPRYEPK